MPICSEIYQRALPLHDKIQRLQNGRNSTLVVAKHLGVDVQRTGALLEYTHDIGRLPLTLASIMQSDT
jgi:hypothetical protein